MPGHFCCSHAEITGGGAEFNIPFVNRVAPLLQKVMDSCILFIVTWEGNDDHITVLDV